MQINKAVITAAGFGSRFLPITKTFPKEMLPIIDKPILQYLIEECQEAGITEVIVVAAPSEVSKFEDYFFERPEKIKALLTDQGKLDRWQKVEDIFNLPKVTVIAQDESIPYGNGRPILSAKSYLENEEAFVVMFGDDLVLSDVSSVKQLTDYFTQNPSDVLLGVQRVPDDEVDKYGIVKLKDGSETDVERVIEKPKKGEAPSNLASYGRFVITPKIFDYLKPDSLGLDNEVWLQDANDKIASTGKVSCMEVKGEWMTTGDPLRYLRALMTYVKNDEKLWSELKPFLQSII